MTDAERASEPEAHDDVERRADDLVRPEPRRFLRRPGAEIRAARELSQRVSSMLKSVQMK